MYVAMTDACMHADITCMVAHAGSLALQLQINNVNSKHQASAKHVRRDLDTNGRTVSAAGGLLQSLFPDSFALVPPLQQAVP